MESSQKYFQSFRLCAFPRGLDKGIPLLQKIRWGSFIDFKSTFFYGAHRPWKFVALKDKILPHVINHELLFLRNNGIRILSFSLHQHHRTRFIKTFEGPQEEFDILRGPTPGLCCQQILYSDLS